MEKLPTVSVPVLPPAAGAAVGWLAAPGQPVPLKLTVVVKFDKQINDPGFVRSLIHAIKPAAGYQSPDFSQMYTANGLLQRLRDALERAADDHRVAFPQRQ